MSNVSQSLIKFEQTIEFIDEQNLWYDFIDKGTLNVNKLATESSIARSVFYHNPKVSARRKLLISELVERGIIDTSSKQEDNDEEKIVTAPKRDTSSREISRLKEDVRKLQNQIATLKAQLKEERAKNSQLQQQQLALSSGRYLR